MSRDDSNLGGDDSSSIGAKEEDEDEDNDEDLEDNSGDPERLKAFNVSLNDDVHLPNCGDHHPHRCVVMCMVPLPVAFP